MTFRLRIQVNYRRLANLEAVPERAFRLFQQKLVTTLAPELQQATNALMIPGPFPVSSPFAFATDRSRRFYFALIRANPSLVEGGHWKRTLVIEKGFRVLVVNQPQRTQLTVRNVEGKAVYPYSYRVPGHVSTGWPGSAEIARELLHEFAVPRIVELFEGAMAEALRGANGG